MAEDATREEAIQWARANKCDFHTPVYPPPDGWMWVAPLGTNLIYLTAIFTGPNWPDITADDVP